MPTPPHVYDEFVRLAQQSGAIRGGHHNQNFVQPLTAPMAKLVGGTPGRLVLVRVPRSEAGSVVIRTWPNEAELLRALEDHVPHVPRLLATTPAATVLSYAEGVPLSHLYTDRTPLPGRRISELVQLLVRTMSVHRRDLPALPTSWPRDDQNSRGFLRTLVHAADRQIRRPNWPTHARLFTRLGIPEDVLERIAERVPRMTDRPFGLLHGDLHRDNVIVKAHDDSLIAVDWELATYGDPLYDLATHLVRMRYPDSQAKFVIETWVNAVEEIAPAAAKGLDEDLKHYIGFERAQSVFPDVIRAARLLRRPSGQKSAESAHLEEAVSVVQDALQAGAAPLGLQRVPDSAEVRDALREWQVSRAERRTAPVDSIANASHLSAAALVSLT